MRTKECTQHNLAQKTFIFKLCLIMYTLTPQFVNIIYPRFYSINKKRATGVVCYVPLSFCQQPPLLRRRLAVSQCLFNSIEQPLSLVSALPP